MTWILIDSNVCLSVCLEASDICHSRDDSQSKTEKNLDFFGVCPKLLDIGVKLRMNISASVVSNFCFHSNLCGNIETFGLFLFV